jgi:hypothetical protein
MKPAGMLSVSVITAASWPKPWDYRRKPLTAADIYDALSSQRAYKEPFPEEKCQQIFRGFSGTILDPAIVEVFFQNIEQILKIKEEWKD